MIYGSQVGCVRHMTPVLRLAIRMFHEVDGFIFGALVTFEVFLFLIYCLRLLCPKFGFEVFVGNQRMTTPVLGGMCTNGIQVEVALMPIL